MDKKCTKQDINEAKEQLEEILKKLNKDDLYDITEFELDMQHVFSHLNVAYNTRNWTEEAIKNFNQEDYEKCKKTPNDLIFIN